MPDLHKVTPGPWSSFLPTGSELRTQVLVMVLVMSVASPDPCCQRWTVAARGWSSLVDTMGRGDVECTCAGVRLS